MGIAIRVVPDADQVRRTDQRPDYLDAFQVGASTQRDAEQWLRAMLEQVPTAMRWFLIVGWHGLTLRLGSRQDPDRVFGWAIVERTPQRAVLATESLIGVSTRLVLWRDGDTVTIMTVAAYRNAVSRAVWWAVAPLHRRILPMLLGRAAART